MKPLNSFGLCLALWLFVSGSSWVSAQSEAYRALGAEPAAMGGVFVMKQGFWGIFHNPASTAYNENKAIGLHYHNQNPQLLKELSVKAAAFLLPTATGNFGLRYTHYGYTAYHENQFALTYAKALGQHVAVGIAIDYFHSAFGEKKYGNNSAALGELGLLIQPTDEWLFAAYAFNPTGSGYWNYTTEKLPTVLRFGMGHCFAGGSFLGIETEKNTREPLILKIGLEQPLVEGLILRTGLRQYWNEKRLLTPTFGAGWHIKFLHIDLAMLHHPLLGFSSHFSLSFQSGV